MIRRILLASAALPLVLAGGAANAQQADRWDQMRERVEAQQPGAMAQALRQWKNLTESEGYGFETYANFIEANPGLPRQELIQRRAERALDKQAVPAARLVAFHDRFPPLTNTAKARYAMALGQLGRDEAFRWARESWRGGEMNSVTEVYLSGLFGSRFTQADHDMRMDALLWQRSTEAAARAISFVSPAKRDLYMARLAIIQGSEPQDIGLNVPANARSDPGYLYNQARQWRRNGQQSAAVALLANAPTMTAPALDGELWLAEVLEVARDGGASSAFRIAQKVDQAFAPDADISDMSYSIRDDYTSLVWLGGTSAMWQLDDPAGAAPLFYRYGAAAKTAPTRSKGFYWAGFASQRAGNQAEANRYYEMAAQYPDMFYGQLALERLGREFPTIAAPPTPQPTEQERVRFAAMPLVQAVKEAARGGLDWRDTRYFLTELAEWADTPTRAQMVYDLAQELGRRDLAVHLGAATQANGVPGFERVGYPKLDTPINSYWTMVHAISRQESEFATKALSHANAYGLMQLIPGTAQDTARNLGVTYSRNALLEDPQYNMRLGNAYFAQLMDRFGGSYPLALVGYNAGPGRAIQWIERNGDPRKGEISWEEWIEKIPFFETKNYVQRVLGNAVAYEQLYPEQARYGTPRTPSRFLGRPVPSR
ncbi:lytic transglycosylase domain-containing protein [Blastomonas marina]|nr:lytic transglycosylase domain-containing protein [Blastomonas marina]